MGAPGPEDEAAPVRLDELRRREQALGDQLRAGTLDEAGYIAAIRPLLVEREGLEVQLYPSIADRKRARDAWHAAHPPAVPAAAPERPGLGARIGRALLLLVMFPISGIPYAVAILVESLVIAWLAAEVFAADFGTVARWLLVAQAGLALLFAVPPLIGGFVHVLRTGELPE